MNWTHIMIHHSFTEDGRELNWNAIIDWHVNHNGWSDVGYHFGVETTDRGAVALVGRPLTVAGAHCSQQGMNSVAIGICVVGNYDVRKPDLPHLSVLAHRLVIPLMDLFTIPLENIVFHREYAKYKSCPGTMFNKEHFIRYIKELRGA